MMPVPDMKYSEHYLSVKLTPEEFLRLEVISLLCGGEHKLHEVADAILSLGIEQTASSLRKKGMLVP